MNPNSDAGLLALTGWDNTPLSVEELSAEHNGTTEFYGREDYAGDPNKFPVGVLATSGVITNQTQIKWYVDRDPVIFYTGLTTLAEVDLTEDPENPLQVYYDAPFNVDTGYLYAQTGFTERWYFTKGDYQVFSKEISFTDPDSNKTIPAGRTGTISVDVTFQYAEIDPILPKVWEYTTDEFLLDNIRFSVDELNTNPTGVMTLTHRVAPTFVDDNTDIYHTANNLAKMQSKSDKMRYCL
jgi:hypothetical protein